MATATMSTSRPLGWRPAGASKTPFSTVRSARAVRVTTAVQDNHGPKNVVLNTFKALAAVQLVLLPSAGTAIANIIPNPSERAEINYFKGEGEVNATNEIKDKVQSDVGTAAADKKAKNVVSDLSDLPNRVKGIADPQTAQAKSAKNAVKDLGDTGKVPSREYAKRTVDKNTPNLPRGGGLPGTGQNRQTLDIAPHS